MADDKLEARVKALEARVKSLEAEVKAARSAADKADQAAQRSGGFMSNIAKAVEKISVETKAQKKSLAEVAKVTRDTKGQTLVGWANDYVKKHFPEKSEVKSLRKEVDQLKKSMKNKT